MPEIPGLPTGLPPLAALGLGAFLLAAALGQRLAARGLEAAAPAFLVRWLVAGLLAWGTEELAWRAVLDTALTAGGPWAPWVQGGLDLLGVALASGLGVLSMLGARRGDGKTDVASGASETPWQPSTAMVTFGGLIAGMAAGLAAATAALWGAAVDPLALLARAADVMNLGAAGALTAWAWQRLAAGGRRGLAGGMTGALALRGAFVWMLQAEFPWPFLGVGLAAMCWLVAWRYIGDVRVVRREKPPRPRRRKTGLGCGDDC